MQSLKLSTSTFTNAINDTEIYVTELAQASHSTPYITIEHGGPNRHA